MVAYYGACLTPISLGVYAPLSHDVVAGGADVACVGVDGFSCSADACYE